MEFKVLEQRGFGHSRMKELIFICAQSSHQSRFIFRAAHRNYSTTRLFFKFAGLTVGHWKFPSHLTDGLQ
jgi:hypothetical protein